MESDNLPTPRKGHHRWVDSAAGRASSSIQTSGSASGMGGWEEASQAAQVFLKLRSGDVDRVPQLRYGSGGALSTGPTAAEEVALARAEYDELRTMHLLFVEASNRKMADLQEACRFRQLEIEALRSESAAEKKERDRLAGDLTAARHALAEKAVELQIAHDALQPFLVAREGLLQEDALGSQRRGDDRGERAGQAGILKKLVRDVPLLERALDRDERLRETDRKNVKDQQAVLVAAITATRVKGLEMCATLRRAARKTRAMHAFRNISAFERQQVRVERKSVGKGEDMATNFHSTALQRTLLKALRAQVDRRLARCCFAEFIHQAKQSNLVRRRGYLASVRHVRVLKLSVFAAWRCVAPAPRL